MSGCSASIIVQSYIKKILVQMYNVLANAATNILQSSVNIRGSDYVAVPLLQYNTNTKEMQIEIQYKYKINANTCIALTREVASPPRKHSSWRNRMGSRAIL